MIVRPDIEPASLRDSSCCVARCGVQRCHQQQLAMARASRRVAPAGAWSLNLSIFLLVTGVLCAAAGVACKGRQTTARLSGWRSGTPQHCPAPPLARCAAPGGASSPAMGFHEGARRDVRCEGGFVTGIDVYFGSSAGFTELSVHALRIKCSRCVRVSCLHACGCVYECMPTYSTTMHPPHSAVVAGSRGTTHPTVRRCMCQPSTRCSCAADSALLPPLVAPRPQRQTGPRAHG